MKLLFYIVLLLITTLSWAMTPEEYLYAKGYSAEEIAQIITRGRIDHRQKELIDSQYKASLLGTTPRVSLRSNTREQGMIGVIIPAGSKHFGQREQEIAPAVTEAAKTHLIDHAWIYAIIRTESNFDPMAVSNKGAAGMMQLMPKTAQGLGVTDRFNIRENIMGGTQYFRQLLDRFGDTDLALAAYVSGPQRVEEAGRKVPDIEEVRDYIRTVKKFYKLYIL